MTVLDLFNNSLGALGYKTFLGSENSTFPEGVACRREWPGARTAVLSAHEWGWLTLQVPISDIDPTTCDATGKAVYLYPRPPAALRIVGVLDQDERSVKWSAVNAQIQTETEVALIRYIPDDPTPEDWPTAIQDAVALALAARIAIPLGRNPKDVQAAAATTLLTAIRQDSSEIKYGGTSADRYINARR